MKCCFYTAEALQLFFFLLMAIGIRRTVGLVEKLLDSRSGLEELRLSRCFEWCGL